MQTDWGGIKKQRVNLPKKVKKEQFQKTRSSGLLAIIKNSKKKALKKKRTKN